MAGLLFRDIVDEDVVKEEFREKFKVISNGELRVELGGVGVDLVLDVDFEVDEDVDFMLALVFANILVEIEVAVELGCIVEANIGEVGVEIHSEVEEYIF